jgi:precorrin-6B methylase 2
VPRVIDEHLLYLRDRHRVRAFARALEEVVTPGAVVVDLASGTGILGMLACRAGAGRVYAIEREGIAGLARQIALDNGCERVIIGLRGHSRDITLPERADVVVCDQIGSFGLEAGILKIFRDARERFLRPGGLLIPNGLDLSVAPVEHARLHRRVTFWRNRPAGFDYGAAADAAANAPYGVRLRSPSLLAEPARVAALDLTIEQPLPLNVSGVWHASRDGILHGLAGWFVAHLSPRVTMTNSPVSGERVNRRQLFFPLAEAVPIRAGTRLEVSMRILPGADLTYAWDLEVSPTTGAPIVLHHSTLRGLLVSKEDLRRTHPQHRPALTNRGAARLATLHLCDGQHTVAEIEQAIYRDHQHAFSSKRDAAALVADVLRENDRP